MSLGLAAAPEEPASGLPIWILDSGSGNHLTCENKLPEELRQAIRRNATSVRMATANGPTTAKDIVDIEVPGLEASARVLLLNGCPPVLSMGRLVEEHACSFKWDRNGAILTEYQMNEHECVVKTLCHFSALLTTHEGMLMRVPQGSRIFVLRVGALPPPKVHLTSRMITDQTRIDFALQNPKDRERYKKYKVAKTVKEAIELGANRRMIRYYV